MKIMSRKTAFRIFLLLAFLGMVAAGIHFYWKWRTEEYKRQLEASGEKLLVADVVPPATPPAENGAALFRQAAALLNPDPRVLERNPPVAMNPVTPGKAMVGWAQPGVRNEADHSTNSWKEIEEALAKENGALKLFQQIIDRPSLNFDLNYDPRLEKTQSTHLERLRKAVQRLAAAALCDLHRGDPASAAIDLRAILALIKGTQDERLAITQRFRMTIAGIAMATTWELLQSPHATEAELVEVQHAWMQVEFREAAENALAMERAMSEATIGGSRKSRLNQRLDFITGQTADWTGKLELQGRQLAWRFWWSYPDELQSLKGYQVLLQNLRFVQTNYAFRATLFAQRSQLAELGINTLTRAAWWEAGALNENLRTIFSRSVQTFSADLDELEKAEIARQMALSALAVKRYQLRHAAYPPELAALVPEFLPSVPRDPVDGKPLRYQSIGKTFLLYSVGNDGVDNGGDPAPAPPSESADWMNGRDYVWPSPATDQEIQAYEKRLLIRPH